MIDKIEGVQNRAVRFILNKYSGFQSVTQMKACIEMEHLDTRRKKRRLKLIHAIYNNLTGVDRSIYLKKPHYISKRKDHSKKIREIKCRTNYMKFSFFPRAIGEWNELPADMVSADNETFLKLLNEL